MSLPPLFSRGAKHAIGKAGRRSEKRLAKDLGARLIPASGAIQGHKGDFSTEHFLFEAKSTLRASIPVQLDWLLKIRAEARAKVRKPAVALSFVDLQGNPREGGEWVMLRRSDFEELIREPS